MFWRMMHWFYFGRAAAKASVLMATVGCIALLSGCSHFLTLAVPTPTAAVPLSLVSSRLVLGTPSLTPTPLLRSVPKPAATATIALHSQIVVHTSTDSPLPPFTQKPLLFARGPVGAKVTLGSTAVVVNRVYWSRNPGVNLAKQPALGYVIFDVTILNVSSNQVVPFGITRFDIVAANGQHFQDGSVVEDGPFFASIPPQQQLRTLIAFPADQVRSDSLLTYDSLIQIELKGYVPTIPPTSTQTSTSRR